MAINFSRLFTSLGKIIGNVNSANTYQSTTLPARVAILDADFVSPRQDVIDGLYAQQDEAQVALNTWLDYNQGLALAVLEKEVNLDRPQANNSLGNLLKQVADGLRAASETVTISATTLATVDSQTVGDAVLQYFEGFNPDDLYYTDSYLLEVTQDQTTGATPFSELVTVTGKANVSSLDWRWPQGSSVATGLPVVDSAQDSLVASSIGSWTASPSGDMSAVASTGPRLSDPTYTSYKLEATTGTTSVQYDLPILAPGSYTGTIFVLPNLTNAAGRVNVYIEDAAGNVLYTQQWDPTNAVWTQLDFTWTYQIQPPVTLGGAPLSQQLRIRWDVNSPTATDDVTFAYAGFQQAFPLYQGGPVMFIWAGSVPNYLGDKWTASTTRGTSETVSLYRGMERLFGLSQFSPFVTIPTGNPGTYTNALVV